MRLVDDRSGPSRGFDSRGPRSRSLRPSLAFTFVGADAPVGPIVGYSRCVSTTKASGRRGTHLQVDQFVKGPLGLVVHDFGARTENPVPIAVVEFDAASAAA
jgi:hypothetical protein